MSLRPPLTPNKPAKQGGKIRPSLPTQTRHCAICNKFLWRSWVFGYRDVARDAPYLCYRHSVANALRSLAPATGRGTPRSIIFTQDPPGHFVNGKYYGANASRKELLDHATARKILKLAGVPDPTAPEKKPKRREKRGQSKPR